MTFIVSVCAFALYARAGVAFGEADFPTGTSFENRETGALDAKKGDDAGGTGDLYWLPATTIADAVVTNYEKGAAYDYAAHGIVRNALFQGEHAGTNSQYLAVDLGETLDRTILPLDGSDVTNVYLKTTDYDGLYADTLVKFSTSTAGPTVDEADRIVVWMREYERDDGSTETNLMVTAGRYAGDYKTIEAVDYKIVSPTVAVDTWCRLTIRAISDVTEYRVPSTSATIAMQAPGFTVYVDGQPAVVAEGDYDIGEVSGMDFRSSEARVLMAERRLFPSLAVAKTSYAVTLSRLSVGGLGAVDDVSFSSDGPGFGAAEKVFTLNWDAGVISPDMLCIVSNAAAVVTNHIDATKLPRYRDFAIGTNGVARVTVTNVVYDFAHGYSNGVWSAENGCTTNGNGFVCDGTTGNPIGYVASSRDVISVGGDSGCETFDEAITIAHDKGGRQTILLKTDVVIAVTPYGAHYRDKGYFPVTDGDDLILDLNGHTLQGSGKDPELPTVQQTGGRLLITDTSDAQTGRVLPRAADKNKVAVQSYADQTSTPVLTIDAGWYDGLVAVTGRVARKIGEVNCRATCCIEGGGYTNYYNDAYRFYLDQYATNGVPPYFRLADDYWTLASTNGFIWSGAGADDLWTNKDNWKGKAVPGAGDLAIFPATNGAWRVDFGAGVATKSLWLDGDIFMTGTNEFSDVKILSGTGRLVGTGLATFTGKLPGLLTGETGAGEIRLGADWAGLVRISSVTNSKPETLANITGWGNARSKVEFNGVRGYLSDRLNHAANYELILTDLLAADGTKAYDAWKNETGYTGSTISFPRLSGSGTLDSPKNLREVLQVIQFKDVRDFTGSFKFGGKRLLLGTGVVTAKAKAGHFTFSSGANVRSGLGWEGVSAHFGTNLVVYGQLKQELMSYNKKESPAVEAVSVTLIDAAEGTTNDTFRLKADAGKITIVTGDSVDYDGKSVSAEDMGAVLKNGSTFAIPPGSSVTIDSQNRVIVNGVVASTFADYYLVQQVDDSTFAVAFDEEEVTPTLAAFTISEADGTVSIKVDNAKDDLWYGLQAVSSLAEDWPDPEEWAKPVDGELTFDPGLTGDAKFFRVLVTDRDPKGGGE